MKPTFPLFRLPENVIVQVLQNLHSSQLLIFSLVSSKTKSLVTSLGFRAFTVFINISHEIGVMVHIGTLEHLSSWNLIFRNDSNDQNAEFDITCPISASFQFENKTFQPSTPFNFSNWLDHIRAVFCYNKPLHVFFWPGSERFEMVSLKNAMKNVNCLDISEGITDIQSRKILQNFKDLNELTLRSNPLKDTCEVQKFFIQNFEFIKFHGIYLLDDILLTNSEGVIITRPISQKQFNRFVKHWIRGSNPRLQNMSLSIDITNSVSGDLLLKGIPCDELEEEEQQEICQELSIQSDYMVVVRRNDGTSAVIASNKYENNIHIYFFTFY
ncbi:hypothetical protein CRE_23076 [Caenorhabditis remanei]|uniref:F-box domain-containing protein n=1 Tax=Caenorhabditis remanei TaxID=31234 RepID=E3N9C9_CAERE|nr:hypothetical protein CRE_23076 [Caenorhabditis remanei]